MPPTTEVKVEKVTVHPPAPAEIVVAFPSWRRLLFGGILLGLLTGAFFAGYAVAEDDVCKDRIWIFTNDSSTPTCHILGETSLEAVGSLEDCPHECDKLHWKANNLLTSRRMSESEQIRKKGATISEVEYKLDKAQTVGCCNHLLDLLEAVENNAQDDSKCEAYEKTCKDNKQVCLTTCTGIGPSTGA